MQKLILTIIAICWAAPALAHGGGLNAAGCHNDRKNGGYHCHRGSSAPAPVYRPPVRSYPSLPLLRERYAQPAPIQPLVSMSPVTLPEPLEGMAQVLDGDTIQIGTTRIRLFGIDAFEAEQMCSSGAGRYGCGGRATRALSALTESKPISCVKKGIDAYGRTLGVCRVESLDLSSAMARAGWALAYLKYALDYVSDERVARDSNAGVWSGTFEQPWAFREGRTTGAAEAQRTSEAPSPNCTIKGNVNAKGDRIYHLPGGRDYARTKPENWFCTEEEALRAGFRRAMSR